MKMAGTPNRRRSSSQPSRRSRKLARPSTSTRSAPIRSRTAKGPREASDWSTRRVIVTNLRAIVGRAAVGLDGDRIAEVGFEGRNLIGRQTAMAFGASGEAIQLTDIAGGRNEEAATAWRWCRFSAG